MAIERNSFISNHFQEMKILLHLCHDITAFSDVESFERAMGHVTEIERQHEDWLNSLLQTRVGKGPGMPKGMVLSGMS